MPDAPRRLLAALSGGVDSAVAAARVVEAGHDVTAVHLALSARPGSGSRGCCTLDDARDARRIADALGVPYYVWDLADRFGEDVIDDFVAEYAAGRTPNPCVRCNERIKFAAVLDRALALGFDGVVTGHHARLQDGELRRSADLAKDQSYVLASLRPDQLAGAVFPLGDSTKAAVRVEASERGLAVADKPDSHDICFIPSGDTAAFLRARIGSSDGAIRDAGSGEELGRHDGTYAFTVGQRRGLRVHAPAAGGAPRYVLGIEPATNTVLVGPRSALDVREVRTGSVAWLTRTPPAGGRGRVQLRAHGQSHPCSLRELAGSAVISLDDPVSRVAPGQLAVVYDDADEQVLGAARVTA